MWGAGTPCLSQRSELSSGIPTPTTLSLPSCLSQPPGRRISPLAASCPCSVGSEGGSHFLEEDSEAFKMLQENREGRGVPRQSNSFRLLQEALEAEERGETGPWVGEGGSPRPQDVVKSYSVTTQHGSRR